MLSLYDALQLKSAGLSVIPIKTDGSKGPAIPSWKPYQSTIASDDELETWYGSGTNNGVGIIAGAISQNLLVLDFDDRETAVAYRKKVVGMGAKGLFDRLPAVQTPSGGYHVYMRTRSAVPGNQKLAMRKTAEGSKVLIETRGEGGYVLGPGCPAECHKNNKPYKLLRGSLADIPCFEDEECQLFLQIARSFNEYTPEHSQVRAPESEGGSGAGERPGDAYNSRHSWSDVLPPFGWKAVRTHGGKTDWIKPGKQGPGLSATTNHAGTDLLYVFSTSASPFESERTYDKFAAYALLNHNGDFSEAAKALARSGYGAPVTQKSPGSAPPEECLDWLDPVLFGEIETPPIGCDLLPKQIGDFARELSRYTQTPEEMSVMLVLAVAATCVQKRFEVSPYGGDYTEPLAFWTVVAMPPASRKSAVVSALREPLNDWERDQCESTKMAICENRTKREVFAERIKGLRKLAAAADNPHDRDQLIEECSKIDSEVPDEMKAPRLWTSDITAEQLQNLLVEHGERMAVLADEGGIFEVMSGLYNDGKVNIDVFLQAHAGASVRVDRGSRQALLDKPALTFGLAVQPSIIAELSQGSKKKFRGNGALARFLYCIPKSNIGSRQVGKTAPITSSVKAAYHACIHKMLAVDPLVINQKEVPRVLMLTEQASNAFTQFSAWIESKQGERGEFELIQDWTGKLPGEALRIAGICHVVEHGGVNPNINEQTMSRALDICQLLIGHAQAAFELMGCDPSISDAKYILKWLIEQGEKSCKQNDIHRLSRFKNGKVDRVLEGIKVLHERHILSRREDLATRKPTLIYHVNPAIFGRGSNGLA